MQSHPSLVATAPMTNDTCLPHKGGRTEVSSERRVKKKKKKGGFPYPCCDMFPASPSLFQPSQRQTILERCNLITLPFFFS